MASPVDPSQSSEDAFDTNVREISKAARDALDASILGVSNSLLSDLGLSERVNQIEWLDFVVRPDRPRFFRSLLQLHVDLKWKLTAEEWRPLLAASLIYENRFRWRRWIAGLTFVGVTVSLLAAYAWFDITRILPLDPGCTYRCPGATAIVGQLAIGTLLTFLSRPYFRRLRLQGDRRTIEELGIGNELIEALKKVVQLLPYYQPKYPYLSWSPSISKRIANLSSETASVSS